MSKLIGSSDKSSTLLSSGTQHTIQNNHKSTLLAQESAHLCEVEECTEGELRIENCLSEFQTEEQKALALRNLGLETIAKWGKISGFISDQKDLKQELDKINEAISKTININFTAFQEALNKKIDKENINGTTAIQQISYTNDAYEHIKTLEDALNQLLYKELTVAVSCNPNVAERGSTVNSVTLSWTYNKTNIKTQTVNNILKPVNNVLNYSETITGPFKSKQTWTVVGNDGTKSKTASTSLNFYPAIYYGSAKSINSSKDVESLSRSVRENRKTSLTVTATGDNYIFICIPHEYDPATFTVGGFTGGFTLVNDNFYLTKYQNTSVRYRIYKSDNSGLGTQTIIVS